MVVNLASRCVLCHNTGTCTDCEFRVPAMPHGVQDLNWPEPVGLRVGDIVCLQCGWHPSCNAQQSRHYFRFVSACLHLGGRVRHALDGPAPQNH
jgi:hypothetical protein